MQNMAENMQSNSPNSSTSAFDLNAFIARVQAVLLDPKSAWPVIKAEQLSVKDFYMKYFLVLSAIPAVCGFIGMQLFGFKVPLMGTISVPFFSSLHQHVLVFGLGLVTVYVMAMILEFLAPKFAGSTTTINALKLAGFSMVPGSLAGILSLYPSGLLSLVSLLIAVYSIYVFWVGIPEMTGVPEEKRLTYCLASAVCCIVASLIINLVVLRLLGPNFDAFSASAQTSGGELDFKKFEEQMKQIQKMLPANQN